VSAPGRSQALIPKPFKGEGTSVSRVLLLAVAALQLGAGMAIAAEPKKAAPATPHLASREELRVCLIGDQQIEAARKQLDARGVAHDAALAQVQVEADRLAKEHSRLHLGNELHVDTFNAEVERHNLRVQEVNAQGEKLRAESDAFSGVVVAHNKRCMPMVYRLEDRDAILKELRARKT
jgi:hypothetical protein